MTLLVHRVDISSAKADAIDCVLKHTQQLRWAYKASDFDLTYAIKYERALTYLKDIAKLVRQMDDDSPEFAYIREEAEEKSVTMQFVATSIVERAKFLEAYDAKLERYRQRAQAAIYAASQPSEVDSACGAFLSITKASLDAEVS